MLYVSSASYFGILVHGFARHLSPLQRRTTRRLNYHDSGDRNEEAKKKKTTAEKSSEEPESPPESSTAKMGRLNLAGVSISAKPPGFFVLMNASESATLPLQVTSDPQDAYTTSSPQALTIIQLLAGVDMAGAILPPETLAKIVVLACESIPEPFLEPAQQQLLSMVQQGLASSRAAANLEEVPQSSLCYSDAHPWLQSRCPLPQVTLDEVVLSYHDDDATRNDDVSKLSDPSKWSCQLRCKAKGVEGSIAVKAGPDLIQAVSYQYDPATSGLFTCLALALRYKAPIQLRQDEEQYVPLIHTPQDLERLFPQKTTVAKLHQSSTRVTKNIERGFEVHKLQKALELARKKGDTQAEIKIRAALDKMDSFQELPVTSHDEDNGGSESGVDDSQTSSFQ